VPVGLVTLCLLKAFPSAYLQPKDLLQLLASMPQLETLWIEFLFPVPNHEIERQLLSMPTTTRVTLPNLYRFRFGGVNPYLEAILRQITAPRLEKLHIMFFSQLTFSVPYLLQFIETTEDIRFSVARFRFSRTGVCAKMYLSEGSKMYAFHIGVPSTHLDWQVASVAQLFNALNPVFSTVEHLTLEGKIRSLPLDLEENHEVDHTNWHGFLRSFGNVKILVVDDSLVRVLSQSLRSDDGELHVDLLPALMELKCNADDVFTSFVDARQNVGRPVALSRYLSSFSDSREPLCATSAPASG